MNKQRSNTSMNPLNNDLSFTTSNGNYGSPLSRNKQGPNKKNTDIPIILKSLKTHKECQTDIKGDKDFLS